MSWRHHDAIARASIPGGLDEILQAPFSSSTWNVSDSTIRRLLMRAQLLVREGGNILKNVKSNFYYIT